MAQQHKQTEQQQDKAAAMAGQDSKADFYAALIVICALVTAMVYWVWSS